MDLPPIQTLVYETHDILDRSSEAIRTRTPVDIVVSGWRARAMLRALRLYDRHFDAARQLIRPRRAVLRFGLFAMLTPTFWGIRNRANLRGWSVSYAARDKRLIVSLRPKRDAL